MIDMMTAHPNAKQTRTARLIAGVLVAAIGVLACSESEARTYRVASVRDKTAQGDWNLTAADSAVAISRQESYGGQWALEQREIGNGKAVTKLLDSSNAVIWENVIGDEPLLSSSAPAFVATSHFSFDRPVYNLNVSSEPVYDTKVSQYEEPRQSRDGTVFGITVGRYDVNIVSIEGELLGYARATRPMRLVAAAIANKGRYAAVAERKYDRSAPGGGTWLQQVSLYTNDGELIGRVGKDAEGNEPLCLALSSDEPPRIAIGTNRGVSFWTPQGKKIWRDSAAFALPTGNLNVPAMYITDDGHVLALTTADAPGGTLWAWNPDGKREAQLELPAEFDASSKGAAFIGATDSSVTLQSFGQILTVEWTDE